MINYADRAKNPSFATSKAVLNILQTHYPERLGHALIANVPFLLNAFYKLITPFIDPRTRVKMKFNPAPVQDGLFAPEMLLGEGGWGGAADFRWEHSSYWPALLQLCAERRERQMERWRALGSTIGLSEWDLKLEPIVSPVPADEAKAVVEVADAPKEVTAAAAEQPPPVATQA
jgi:hypothetical protein